MLVDARSLPDGHELEVDVCVVGAGPAGIILATELAGRARVCLLDAGGRAITKADRRRMTAESVGSPYIPLNRARASAFGGTAVYWPKERGWRARRFDAIDFEHRDGVPYSGWPIGYEELEPYYRRAEALSHLASEDARYRQDVPWPGNSDRLQPAVVQFSPTFFPDMYDEVVRMPGVTLLLHAQVVELATDANPERVDRAMGRHHDGRSFAVRAGTFVLAAGAIENARLLLLSRQCHATGLGNSEDLVGRFFMERMNSHAGYVKTTFARQAQAYELRSVAGRRVQATLNLSAHTIREERLLNCAFYLLPRSDEFTTEGARSAAVVAKELTRRPRPPHLLRHLRNVARDGDALIRLGLRHVLRRHNQPSALILRISGEQAPNPQSRVTLGQNRDAAGLPRARLDWRPTDFDRQRHRRSEDILAAEFERAGVGRVERRLGDEDPPAFFEGGHHHMGTTRMHADPRYGVVDANCRVHDLENLYVAGGSVFATSGATSPTLTILALAYRLAAHLHQVFRPTARLDPR